MYKNRNFYFWLIETTFKFFQIIQSENSNDPNYSFAISIYDLGKKIHVELIMNTILKDEKLRSEPMIKISNLLSWGIYYKNLFCNQKSNYEVNDFIKFLMKIYCNCM